MEVLLDELEPMWVQLPVIFVGDFAGVDDDFTVDEVVELGALVKLTRSTAAGPDRAPDVVAVAAPAVLEPSPSPAPAPAALITSAASAVRLRCPMSFSFVR